MDDQSNSKTNRHTWHPDGPTHRRHPSYRNDVGNGGVLSSKPAVKRLFSNRSPSHDRSLNDGAETFYDAENGYGPDREGEASQSAAKRQRSGEWPLPNTSRITPSRTPLRSRASLPNSPNYPNRVSSIQPRPALLEKGVSSFIEGSMNDRVSVPPPATYMDHDDQMESYHTDQQRSSRAYARTDSGNFLPRTEDPALPSDAAKTDSQKPYRFGRKNVFSVFNPTNWPLFTRTPKEPKAKKDHERIEVSQEAYQLHKASGAFKAHTTQSSRFPPPPSMTQGAANSSAGSPQRARHNSAVEHPARHSLNISHEFPKPLTPRNEKRFGRIYEPPAGHDYDPLAPSASSVSQASYTSDDDSSRKRRSSFSFKRSSHHHSASTSDLPVASTSQSPNKVPSKKQLAKEQKLVTKISNLESQLAEARHQLATSINRGEPQPMTTMEQLNKTLGERPRIDFDAESSKIGRRPFQPGLPTLHSERLLSDHVQPYEDDDHDSEEELVEKVGVASGGDEAGVHSPNPNAQLVAELSVSKNREAQAIELDLKEAAPSGDRVSSNASAILPGITSEQPESLHADEQSDSDLSSIHGSEVTGSTVIHHHESLESTGHQQHGMLEQEEGEDTPKAVPVNRKVSTKRKNFADGDDDEDDDYKPSSKSSGSDDGSASDEDTKDVTPVKSVPAQSMKKQKTTATGSPKNIIGKRSFDSPKGSFVSSTKYPKRASASAVSPPKVSSTPSPKGNFVNSTKFSKRTSVTPPIENKRKSFNQYTAPPSSASFNFAGGKHARPGTPNMATPGKKPSQIPQKRPVSPSLVTASGAKLSIPTGQAMKSYSNEVNELEDGDEDAIPPVPKLSEEMLKKHRESGIMKRKTLTIEDIHRQQKAVSSAGSTHPDQDIARQSIEKEVTVKSTKTRVVKKTSPKKKGGDEEFNWDKDTF